MAITPDVLYRLIPLLAESTALWLPLREHGQPWHLALLERQTAFRPIGLPVPREHIDHSGRRADQRELIGLQSTGLVVVSQHRGRIAHWRLSPAGLWSMLTWVGLPGHTQASAAIAALTICEGCPNRAGDQRTPETWLLGQDYSESIRPQLLCLERWFLPGLICGVVVAHSDLEGRVAYETTGVPLPDVPDDLPEYDESAADVYEEAFTDAWHALQAAKPACHSLTPIPLSCGLWGPSLPPKSVRKTLRPFWEALR